MKIAETCGKATHEVQPKWWKFGKYWINVMPWVDKLRTLDVGSDLRYTLWHDLETCHVQITSAQGTVHFWSYLRSSGFLRSLIFEARN